jgi:hypothetical protein
MPDRGSGGRSGRNDRGRQDRARTDRGRADRGRQDRGRGDGGHGYGGRPEQGRAERGRTDRPGGPGAERRAGPSGDRDARQRGGSRRGAAVPDPAVPDDIDVRELDKEVRQELRSLSAPVAERVGAQLAAAARLIDQDPAAALLHARAARRMGGRLPVVREAVGIAAYLSGEWAEALTELRAARRMNGDAAVLPMIADCERALGRPERALEVSRDPAVATLPTSTKVEMMIVESGARKDLGQLDAALLALQGPQLDATGVEDWTHRLWYAYADTLERAGRTDEALRWFGSVRDIDGDETTDADQRYRDLAGSTPPKQ